jgi:hypothetical protein
MYVECRCVQSKIFAEFVQLIGIIYGTLMVVCVRVCFEVRLKYL